MYTTVCVFQSDCKHRYIHASYVMAHFKFAETGTSCVNMLHFSVTVESDSISISSIFADMDVVDRDLVRILDVDVCIALILISWTE